MKEELPIDSIPPYERLGREFYTRDVLEVAPGLLGKTLVIRRSPDSVSRHVITEVEAYRGEEDRACHASRGRTKRTEIMYHDGGMVYMYFVYGMYWMLNVVAGPPGTPQAVLVRGAGIYRGPGILTRELGITGDFYGEDLTLSERIWIEKNEIRCRYVTGTRVGVEYSGKPWAAKHWRFISVM